MCSPPARTLLGCQGTKCCIGSSADRRRPATHLLPWLAHLLRPQEPGAAQPRLLAE